MDHQMDRQGWTTRYGLVKMAHRLAALAHHCTLTGSDGSQDTSERFPNYFTSNSNTSSFHDNQHKTGS